MTWDWNWGRNEPWVTRLEHEAKLRLCNRCGGDSFNPSEMHEVFGGVQRPRRLCAECFKNEFAGASQADDEAES